MKHMAWKARNKFSNQDIPTSRIIILKCAFMILSTNDDEIHELEMEFKCLFISTLLCFQLAYLSITGIRGMISRLQMKF
ncbi:CLUMA_CG007046, isoform A [Clunio marinus]|uniref:CLUMA_CG007046, isoform A n=1 Tax=Clunio marinus TaxID=568069 RepID=A0A1J1I558_9DIPT|nr:CLUMA_CG007046, isoform A [Clunio marinus]